jgi:hypothetical protein
MKPMNASSSERTLFFCFGLPKSGTTLLQRALNMHPQISCPSEHNFSDLGAAIQQLFKGYNRSLQVMDRRTGGQGATPVNPQTVEQVFRAAVEAIVRQAAGKKKIMGANDNTILRNLHAYDQLFEHPKMVAIFRNPIDRALSAWHHNLRLAEEEKDPRHREMMTRHGDLDSWLRLLTQQFTARVDEWRQFVAGREHTFTVTFEDLVNKRAQRLRELFTFLGANASELVVEPIVAATDFKLMRDQSRHPGFFRRAAVDMGDNEIGTDLRSELLAQSADALTWLGHTAG